MIKPFRVDGIKPSDCDRIIIAGAGGLGREVLHWARQAWPKHASKIAGFLSADPKRLDGYSPRLPILGSPEDFEPLPTDGIVFAIGIPGVRDQVVRVLQARRCKFLTLIHPMAIVADTAEIGIGSIICPYVIVSDSAKVGAFVLLNYGSSIGHDANIMSFSVLSPYATLGGNAKLGEDVFMGMHSSVGPDRTVGSRSRISANSCALSDIDEDSLVFGVPGRVAPVLKDR